MTQEEKAERYDRAIKRARNYWESPRTCFDIDALTEMFPELKESEDERIRKAILTGLTDCRDAPDLGWSDFGGIDIDECIDWLEKQCEPTDINPSEFDLRLNKLLKQFETLPKEELANCLSFYLNVVQNDGTYKREEKQGEQPRYSIGDVLCDKSCTTLNKDAQPNFEITDIRNGMYICDKCSFPISQQDEYELVAKKIEQNPTDKVEDEEYNGEDYGIDSLFHAQRILEKTLGKVNGYQTDDGILEHKCAITAIKKLYEQKPADEVKPKFKVGDTMRTLQEANDGYIDGMPVVVSIDKEYYHCTNELIAIKDQDNYEFPPINVKQKPAELSQSEVTETSDQVWSEEDEKIFGSFLHKLEVCDLLSNKEIRWAKRRLKSLRPKKQWKPTEAQLASLTIACDRNDRIGFDLTQLLKELKNL